MQTLQELLSPLECSWYGVDQWAKIQFTTLQRPKQSKPFLQLVLCKDLKDALEMKSPTGIFFLITSSELKGPFISGTKCSEFANKNLCPN